MNYKKNTTRFFTAAAAAFILALPVGAEAQLNISWDCSVDPTTLNSNSDSDNDWVVRGGGVFDMTNISSGVWMGGQLLDSRPINDFNNAFDVNMRWKADVGTTGTFDAAFWVNITPTGGGFAAVYASLTNNGSSQTLTVYHKPADINNGDGTPLATYTDLGLDFLNTKLSFNGSGTLTVTVGATTYAPVNYATNTNPNNDKFATVFGDKIQLDYINIIDGASGGPLPVNFIKFEATQKGGAVAINWSTSSESNNNYFDIQKSTDGSSFFTINTVKGTGNSSTVKNYGSYDAKPVVGYNYYRIKQVDFDGKYKFSDIAKVKINFEKTGISVLANPFVNNIIVDIVSPANQLFNVRLTDISGKMIATELWTIAKGSSRVIFSKVNNLQKGMYIFTVTDTDGNLIYNNKLIKQ